MRLLKLKTLAVGLILAMPAAYATPGAGVMTLALNCPDRNTDPKCPNHVSQAQLQAQQQEQLRAKLQAQQQEQLRAKLQAQQQEQLRAKQLSAQQDQLRAKRLSLEKDQQNAKLRAAQEDQLRAKRLSLEKDQQNAKLRAAQEDQLRAKRLSLEKDQQSAKLRAAQEDQLRAKRLSLEKDQQSAKLRAAQEDQLRAKQLSSQQDQLRAKQFSPQQDQLRAKQLSAQQDQLHAKQFSAQQEQLRAKQLSAQQDQLHAKQFSAQQEQLQAKQLSAQQDQLRAKQISSQQDHLRDKLQGSSDGRRLAAGGHPVTSGQAVAVGADTKVVQRGDHKSFDIRHKNPDGSQMVISQKLLPDGTRKVTGFKQTENARDGTTTRIYSDGRRVTQGRDFERRSVGSGMNFVTKRDGLREAVLPDGRPAFRDRFASFRDRDGSEHRVIERTRYAHWSHGRFEHDDRPMVRQYDVGNIYGEPVAQYRPSHFAPDYYRGFHSRFLAPVVVVAAAAAAWAIFASPATSYDDPVALMGDMQISSGFEEGYADSAPSGAMLMYDAPDAAAVRSQMLVVQQQVNTSVQGDASLKDQLGGVDIQAASSQVQQAVGNAVPVQISEEVRQQVRQQVRLGVAMHQNGRSLVLTDLLASGYTKIYLFQTAQPINVQGASTSECFLNTGDLIGFSTLPAAGSPFAEMKVVASGSNSCRPDELVQVRLADLQEMLNGFSERVEDNMKRVSACAASGHC